MGAASAEIFGLIVAAPLEKRRQDWMNDVAERLKELEENGKVDFEKLSPNEQFIDTIIQATSYAIKTSEKEKIVAFKNAILNTALNECPDSTKSQIFLNQIDVFTGLHIKILCFFNNPRQWFTQAGQVPPNSVTSTMFSILTTAYPELKKEGELVDLIWNDLGNAGFHRTDDLKSMMSGDGTLAKRTTQLAEDFISFISQH